VEILLASIKCRTSEAERKADEYRKVGREEREGRTSTDMRLEQRREAEGVPSFVRRCRPVWDTVLASHHTE
jgi:hypothetical protein